MFNFKKEVEGIQNQQRTIDKMLLCGTLALKDKTSTVKVANRWILEPLHNGEDCNVGFVEISEVKLGECEEHIHPKAKEYLIVVEGSLSLSIDGKFVKILQKGDCATIPPSIKHHCTPLENNTKLIYICIPGDLGMKTLQ
jgi:quercetin dioxygenase-like cupin family protein